MFEIASVQQEVGYALIVVGIAALLGICTMSMRR